MARELLAQTLRKYIPEAAVDICCSWMLEYKIQLRITKDRNSKLGDYQAPWAGKGHRISINHNLNPYAFLITLTHEMAHLKAFLNYKKSIAPHGPEWKQEFRWLMQAFFQLGIFPFQLQNALLQYLQNPAAGTCTDLNLQRALKQYDAPEQTQLTLEEIPEHSIFTIRSRKKLVFRKGSLIRKRFKCIEVSSGHLYLVNPLTEVFLIGEPLINVLP